MTKEDLMKEYPTLKGIYVYPTGQFKVWFKNNKAKHFTSIKHFISYVSDHEELL